MIEKCCFKLFDKIFYKSVKSVVRISDDQVCELNEVEEAERSTLNRIMRGTGKNLKRLILKGEVRFNQNNTQKEIIVVARSRKSRCDVTTKLWKYSRKAKIFVELYRAVMRTIHPMSSVGSLKNTTAVHTHLFSSIGDQISSFCDKQKVMA
jgi:hypothetical protein